MRAFRSPIVAAIAGAVVTASVVGGVAIAQTSTQAVITACVDQNTGNVRIVGSGSDCRPNETTTTWNQQGPQGIPGTNGANGVSGWTRVQGESTVVQAHTWDRGQARCPEGQRVLGGGYFSHYEGHPSGTTHTLTLLSSYPTFDGIAWYVSMLNDTDTSIEFTPYAICATVM